MKLSKQLFIIIATATAAPLVVLWIALGNVFYKDQIDGVRDRHLLIAKNVGGALTRYHQDLSNGFDLIAHNLVAGIKPVQSDKFIRQMRFRHFCIADLKTGKIVAAAAPAYAPCPKSVPAKRFTLFKKLAKPGKTVFSPLLPGPQKQPIIYLLSIIDGKLAIGAINTTYIVETGKAVAFGEKGHAAIIDQQGNLIAHPKPSWVAARKNISKLSIAKEMLAGKSGVMQFFSPAMKQDMIAGYTHIDGTGWSVMIPQPIAELRKQARLAHLPIFLLISACLLASGFIATLVARKIMRPVDKVIDVAREVEQGNNDVEVAVTDSWHVPNEFTQLQERFNAMAKAVSRYQELQRQDRERAERESSNKSEYFANLAHELKTPLNSIMGFSSVLKDAKPGSLKPHETSEFLGHIEKSAGHLLGFVNDLLDLNRLEMGAQTLNEQVFYAIDPVRFCEATLRNDIAEKKIRFEIESFDPKVRIKADERAMNQMMINLVSNAVRYSFDNSVIKVAINARKNGGIRISVSDNGIGIPEKDLADITLPFKRADDPEVANINGTGLGLAIVTKLARLHEMTFSIESEYGFSTSAHIDIPASRVVLDDNKEQAA